MKTKQLISASLALATLASLALVAPAFAQTTPTTPTAPAGQHGAWSGGKGGMRGGMGMMGKPAVVGTVSTVSGNTLTVSGRQGFGTTTPATTFTVDATNAKVMKGQTASTVAGIAVGDTVVVVGTVSGTNITATNIRDGALMVRAPGANGTGKSGQTPAVQGNGEPVVAGTISAINGATLTVTNKSNVTYSVDTTNAKILSGQTASTLSNLKVGDAVVIQGTVNGTSISASSVIDQAVTSTHKNIFSGIGQFFSHLFGF
jgi:hypothetical protein